MEKSAKIKKIKAREILDSKGYPTVEVDLTTDFGVFRTAVPSGVSRGKYEAVELRDGGKRYQGKGVLKAVKNINKIIAPKLKGRDTTQQKEIDNLMIKLDGTKNKSKLGANAILAVSMAVCRAGARAKDLPLWKYIAQIAHPLSFKKKPVFPKISLLLIEGGVHAGNELDFQEFMIVPQVQPFSKALQIATEIYHQLKEIIRENYIDLGINVGHEGGFAPPIRAPEEALNLILKAGENLGYEDKIKIVLDVASSQFFKEGKYQMRIGEFSSEKLLNYYLDLLQKYSLLGLEDPFAEDDWEGWQKLNQNSKLKNQKLLIIGDDLLVTNPQRMKMAKKRQACNSAIIKMNQIGTVSEAIEAAKLAQSYGWKIIVSHRAGETCDDFISDFAVGIGADFIKTGAPVRGERVAKYNRLLRIEEEIEN